MLINYSVLLYSNRRDAHECCGSTNIMGLVGLRMGIKYESKLLRA